MEFKTKKTMKCSAILIRSSWWTTCTMRSKVKQWLWAMTSMTRWSEVTRPLKRKKTKATIPTQSPELTSSSASNTKALDSTKRATKATSWDTWRGWSIFLFFKSWIFLTWWTLVKSILWKLFSSESWASFETWILSVVGYETVFVLCSSRLTF